MSKLLDHFKRMQAQVVSYLQPAQYTPFHGGPCKLDMNAAEEKGRFLDDMIYMLDGPEQREAQAEAQSMADQGYPTEDAYLAACRALHWRTAELRAQGVEPCRLPPDAPHYPPDGYVFDHQPTTQAARAFAAMRRFCERVEKGEVRSKRTYAQFKAILDEAPQVGDGTPDAALAIGEHAFRAGFKAATRYDWNVSADGHELELEEQAWSEYDPPEHIKALS